MAAHKSLRQHADALAKDNAKLQKALAGEQDRGGKRVAELREAARLDQQAKAHLAAAFQGQLEESEARARVLQSQVEALRMQQNTMDDREEELRVLQSQVQAMRLAADSGGSVGGNGPSEETVALRAQVDKMQACVPPMPCRSCHPQPPIAHCELLPALRCLPVLPPPQTSLLMLLTFRGHRT